MTCAVVHAVASFLACSAPVMFGMYILWRLLPKKGIQILNSRFCLFLWCLHSSMAEDHWKKKRWKCTLKKGFSKQVSFKASQSSTSYPLLKTGINVLCREKIYISRQLCSLPQCSFWRAIHGEALGSTWVRALPAGAWTFLLTQLQSYSLLFFSLLSWCYCFYLLLKNYSLIIFQSACLLFYFFSISAV